MKRLALNLRIETVRLTEHWHICKDGDPAGVELYERHYSCYHYKDGRERKLIAGPGEKVVLLTSQGNALFIWRKFIEMGDVKDMQLSTTV